MEESVISPAIFVNDVKWSTSCKIITLNPEVKHINIEDKFNTEIEENTLLETVEFSNEDFHYDNFGMKLEITEPDFEGSNGFNENITFFDGGTYELKVFPNDNSSNSTYDNELSFERHIEISADSSGNEDLTINSKRIYLEIGEDGRKQLKACPDAYPKSKTPTNGDSQKSSSDFSCPFCGKQFTIVDALMKHIPNHKVGDSILCSLCDFSTVDRDLSKRHIKTHHRQKAKKQEKTKKLFNCLQCQFVTSYERRMHVHVDKHFEQVYDNCFECQTCRKQYKDHASLRKHKLSHSGVRPFICTRCGADFFLKAYLTLHTRYSHAEKPFSCAYCPFKFAMKSTLTLHERTHTGEKPFQCKACDYKAVGSKTLLEHYRHKHSVHAPYKCPTCGKGFHTNSRFVKHTKTHLTNQIADRTSKPSAMCDGDGLIANIKSLSQNHIEIT